VTPLIDICIIIPCYNEGERLAVQKYQDFVNKQPDILLCFVNDGSIDNTRDILERIKNNHPDKVDILSYTHNQGKAEAVRTGMLYCNNNYNYKYIAYLDADLSTSLDECVSLINYMKKNVEFCFSSRKMKDESIIMAKRHRILIGEILSLIMNRIMNLKYNDTQCGCKLFSKNLSMQVFEKEFLSKWLFDIEIFFRIIEIFGKKIVIKKICEVPVKSWIDNGQSKVKFSYFFYLWVDIYKIYKTYELSIRLNKFIKY